jgi:hypothetical protein
MFEKESNKRFTNFTDTFEILEWKWIFSEMKSENSKIQKPVRGFEFEFEFQWSIDSISSRIELTIIQFSIWDEIERRSSIFSLLNESRNP